MIDPLVGEEGLLSDESSFTGDSSVDAVNSKRVDFLSDICSSDGCSFSDNESDNELSTGFSKVHNVNVYSFLESESKASYVPPYFAVTPEQQKYCTTRKELLIVFRLTCQHRHFSWIANLWSN